MVFAVKLEPAGKATFTAALNMELSDGWVLTENNGNFDPNARGAHTHHVTLIDVYVTWMTNGFQLVRYCHDYAQWKPGTRLTITVGDNRHGRQQRQIFQYQTDFWVPGLQAFWDRASTGRRSKR